MSRESTISCSGETSVRITGMPYVSGVARGYLQVGLQGDPSGRILLLRQAELQPLSRLPAGFVIVDGAPFAHQMIPLLGYGLPVVIVDSVQAATLSNGSRILIDGSTGLLTSYRNIPHPPEASIPVGQHEMRDGTRIQLRVSVRHLSDARRAMLEGADAVGLLRSEYLIPPGDTVPDTQYYLEQFRSICEAVKPLPVSIRLLDIAADKIPAWLTGSDGLVGPLGLQGVRLFRHEPVRTVYRAQLAAIDVLRREYDIRLLIPYLADVQELQEWSGQIRRHLTGTVPLGAMAETPAATLQIGTWLEIVDFVAVGCNDLMQCLFGADRDNADMRRYLDPYAPALYRFLYQVAVEAGKRLHQVQLCGVLPQLPGVLPLLLGLGFQAFSVEVALLGRLRRALATTSIGYAIQLAEQVCAAGDSKHVRQLLSRFNENSS